MKDTKSTRQFLKRIVAFLTKNPKKGYRVKQCWGNRSVFFFDDVDGIGIYRDELLYPSWPQDRCL